MQLFDARHWVRLVWQANEAQSALSQSAGAKKSRPFSNGGMQRWQTQLQQKNNPTARHMRCEA